MSLFGKAFSLRKRSDNSPNQKEHKSTELSPPTARVCTIETLNLWISEKALDDEASTETVTPETHKNKLSIFPCSKHQRSSLFQISNLHEIDFVFRQALAMTPKDTSYLS